MKTIVEKNDEQTFPNIRKGSNKENSISYATNNSFIQTVNLNELQVHPLNTNIYAQNDEMVKTLADNIKQFSLINRIVINKDKQILCGGLRFRALQLLNVEKIEVYVIDINKNDELEFIISSNHQREKSIIDIRNEIQSLFKKYSPGQGKKSSQENGTNTIKKIAEITGHNKNKIEAIRKIDSVFPDLLNEIDNGNLTINGALKKCDLVIGIKKVEEEIGEKLSNDLTTDKIDKVFDKAITSYCEESYPEYHSMIENDELSPKEAYNDLFKQRNNKEQIIISNGEGYSGYIDNSTYCPCCCQKIGKAEEEEWFKKYQIEITDFISKLKSK